MTGALLRLVRARVDARPLATARIALAAAGLLKSADLALMMPDLASPGALRLPHAWSPLPELGPALGWAIPAAAAAAAIALGLGWRSRTAAFALAGALGVALAADRQIYSNHLWLLICLSALLGLTDCGAVRSLDARRRGEPRGAGGRLVRAWPVRLLQTQLTAVYAFAALTKLQPEFLSGAVLEAHLRPGLPLPAGSIAALAIAAVAVEGLLPIALWTPRLRRAGYAAGGLFHLTILVSMAAPLPLAIFGLTCLAVYPLFGIATVPGAGPTSARPTPRPATATTSISTPP